MGDEPELDLNIRHSYCTSQLPKQLAVTGRRSDIDVGHRIFLDTAECGRMHPNIENTFNKRLGEYYKKYEHDEEPVKDLPPTSTKVIRGKSLTNSELDMLESQIFKSMSQEIKTNNSSMTISVESNIKFFKTTVQDIFDNFYGCMRDFDLYKTRFNDILAKNQVEAVADMEDFIKDMMQQIMTSDSSISADIKHCNTSVKSMDTKECCTITSDPEDAVITPTSTSTNSAAGDPRPVFEAYKNHDYIADSTFDDKVSNIKTAQEEVFNIYLVSGSPFVQVKINDRHLFSEINIKKPSQIIESGKYVASAENIRKLAAKKMELEKYEEHESSDDEGPEREIPVKVSFARQNIHLDEDFTREPETEKSLMSKICSFLCKKFRKHV